MSILSELNTLFESLNLPVETGVFSNKPPEKYIVLTPIADIFELFADNKPQYDIHEVRISLFSQKNYLETKNRVVSALLEAGFTITLRKYISRDDDTGYHHFAIDVAKEYEMEE